ncbi:MAG: cytochrome c [Pseudomonadota bacterium]|nr:cytochrome c [Pseudomonadota bacterium]
MRLGMLLIAAAAAAIAPDFARAADAAKGQAMAEAHCTRCHVVGKFNPNGGISSTPSFQLLVDRRPDYKERFLTFYTRRPHPAFLTVKGLDNRPMPHLPTNAAPVEITTQDVENIALFVESLKGTSGLKPD